MTNEEAIATIKCAIAEVEWNCHLDYAVAFEKAIEALRSEEWYKCRTSCRFCSDEPRDLCLYGERKEE